MAGQAMWVTCHVPRDEQNRWVTWGLDNYTSRTRQMDGEDSPVTYQQLFEHIPCEAGDAFCTVTALDGKVSMVRAPIEVVGCNQ